MSDIIKRNELILAMIPKGRGMVAKSEYFKKIIKFFLQGYSPEVIARILRLKHGSKITADSIRKYVKRYIDPKLLKYHLILRNKLRKNSVYVAIEELSAIQENRLYNLLRLEKKSKDKYISDARFEIGTLLNLYKALNSMDVIVTEDEITAKQDLSFSSDGVRVDKVVSLAKRIKQIRGY